MDLLTKLFNLDKSQKPFSSFQVFLIAFYSFYITVGIITGDVILVAICFACWFWIENIYRKDKE